MTMGRTDDESKREPLSPPSELTWRSAGFTPADALLWDAAGFDPASAHEWRHQKFDLNDATRGAKLSLNCALRMTGRQSLLQCYEIKAGRRKRCGGRVVRVSDAREES